MPHTGQVSFGPGLGKSSGAENIDVGDIANTKNNNKGLVILFMVCNPVI